MDVGTRKPQDSRIEFRGSHGRWETREVPDSYLAMCVILIRTVESEPQVLGSDRYLTFFKLVQMSLSLFSRNSQRADTTGTSPVHSQCCSANHLGEAVASNYPQYLHLPIDLITPSRTALCLQSGE